MFVRFGNLLRFPNSRDHVCCVPHCIWSIKLCLLIYPFCDSILGYSNRQTETEKLQLFSDHGNESNTLMFSSETLSTREIPNLSENTFPPTSALTVEHETGAEQNLNFPLQLTREKPW